MKLTNRLLTDAPLIEAGAFSALLHHFQALGEPQLAEPTLFKAVREKLRPQMTIRDDGIAIVPVEGVLARKPDVVELFYGVEDSQNVLAMIESAQRNPEVKGVLLDVDSPGGFLTGGPEIADAVRATTKVKPVVAFIGGTGASLAYWIASQANQIVASRSAQVGSIGVYTTHVDYTKRLESAGIRVEVIKNKEADFKAAGVMGTALTEEQRVHMQERIQASFGEFKRAVKASRPILTDDVLRGQTLVGRDAKDVGLIDRIGNIEFAMSVLNSLTRTTSMSNANSLKA